MQKQKAFSSRIMAFAYVLALSLAALTPVLVSSVTHASGPLGIPTTRKITMSSSQGGATDVTYTLQFTTAQGGAASNVNGVVVEFCDSSPIIGDSSCTAPSGFNTNKATLNLGTLAGLTSLTVDTTNSTATKVVLTGTNTAVATGTAVTIPFGSGALAGSHYFTNPTLGNHTFYARVLTFTTAVGAQQYASGNIDNTGANAVVDAGGIALSTANQLLITAKVQERLSFCVYTGSCTADTTGAARTTGITLGNTNGVLDPAGPYVDKNAKFDISTNALNGAFVVLKGDTLATGAFTISAIGATAQSSATGTEQFGMCLYQSAGSGLDITTGTVGNSTYNSGTCSSTTQSAGTGTTGGVGTAQFGFNTTNTLSASGDTIAKKPAGATSTATMAFIGNIANTTEAGIYTTTLTLIATGSY